MLPPILPTTAPRLWFEDLHVGQRFVTDSHTLDAAQIVEFARVFDPQPFHTDAVAARETLFGGLAASGWHTAAITMRLLVSSGPPFAAGIIGSGGQLTWSQPVRAEDVLRVEVEILELTPSRSRPERGMVVIRVETRNQRHEVVQVFSPKLLVPRRSTAQQ
ncbi:MAG: MaoC family dehydratase [Acetobacteraceae bacterium]|nr:MaoC family dehydratase [Acetobacteraceae bacterium]